MPVPELPFLRRAKDGAVIVDIHVVPNAARTQIQGLHDGALRVRLNAPPVDGRANLELQTWLARELRIPRAAIGLIRGETGRRKQLLIDSAFVAEANWMSLAPPAKS
jgi:hypothetical protein